MAYNLHHRLARRIKSDAKAIAAQLMDSLRGTYSSEDVDGQLFRYFPAYERASRHEEMLIWAEAALEHRFDILGSGPVKVKYEMSCAGLEGFRYGPYKVIPDPDGKWLGGEINASNLDAAMSIWRLLPRGYAPIEWQLDIKSGWRWSARTHHTRIRISPAPGADIKVPWELARMHHLAALAYGYTFSNEHPQRYLAEFRNQILDFIATNPPGFGVNWKCPMDVAIRAANWLVSYDLLVAAGGTLDGDFLRIFKRSLRDHGNYIASNLEHSPELTANHYLADISGLLVIGAYLPPSPVSTAWLALGIQEIKRETALQFNPDGSNFEASTCYHRLSAEMVAYATALVMGLGDRQREDLRTYEASAIKSYPKLLPAPLPLYEVPGVNPKSFFNKEHFVSMARMRRFTSDITKPSGHVPQIGDNDSGRFLKLFPAFKIIPRDAAINSFSNLSALPNSPENFLCEDTLDHSHLVEVIGELVQDGPEAKTSGPEAAMVRKVISGSGRCVIGERLDRRSLIEMAGALPVPNASAQTFRIQIPALPPGGKFMALAYPDFGLYIYRAAKVYMAIRCGSIGQSGIGGHAHYDQLSVELTVDGRDVVRDPGTYLYTPIPEMRNLYRSAAAHFVPRKADGSEPGVGGHCGLFRLPDPGAKCLMFTETIFCGVHYGYGVPIYRKVEIGGDNIVVSDWSYAFPVMKQDPGRTIAAFSPAYGVREAV